MPRPPVPEGWEFRLSHDRRYFAFYDPGNGPWFVPEPNMRGRFVDSAEMNRLDWYRYVPEPEQPPADRAALRDRIADALAAKFTSGAEHTQGMRVAFEGPDGWPATRMVTPIEAADAVLAVLPDPTDRAAVEAERDLLGREADRLRKDWVEMRTRAERAEAERDAYGEQLDDAAKTIAARTVEINRLTEELRRLAAEAPTTTKPETDDYERTTGHLITCLAVAGGGIDPDCPCAAGVGQDGAQRVSCDGCGHPEHPAWACPVVEYGERCTCDEPVAERGHGEERHEG